MSHFIISAEFEDNKVMEITPEYFHPLCYSDLLVLESTPNAALKLTIEGINAAVNGVAEAGQATVNMTANFAEKNLIYALVPGGWLPLPCVTPPKFLVDRNVVKNLQKIRSGKPTASGKAVEWWIKLVDSIGSATFNPLPYALESGFRRKPTFPEFAAAYEEGAEELAQAVPNCKVIRLDEQSYRAGYALLQAADIRSEKEINFLREVAPMIVNRVSRDRECKISADILSIADKHKLFRGGIVTLAALSCVYEDVSGLVKSIGRRLIKPTSTYSEFDAFNALSDFRHIELSAAGQAYFPDDPFCLCTGDRGLAMLWSALIIHGESLHGNSIEFTFDLTTDLFSRLNGLEIQRLKQRLMDHVL